MNFVLFNWNAACLLENNIDRLMIYNASVYYRCTFLLDKTLLEVTLIQ